jgi:hypothetical protein
VRVALDDGFAPRELDFTPDASRPLRVVNLILAPLPRPLPEAKPASVAAPKPRAAPGGFMSVRSEPALRLYVGSESMGVTPVSHVPMPSGPVELVLTDASMGLTKSIAAEVKSGELTEVSVELRRGQLSAVTEPPTLVFAGGKMLGWTPLRGVELLEGEYKLSLANAELAISTEVTVQIHPGKTTVLNTKLR